MITSFQRFGRTPVVPALGLAGALLFTPLATPAAAVYAQGWDAPGTAGWQSNTAASLVDRDAAAGLPPGSLRTVHEAGAPIPTIGATSGTLDALRGDYGGHWWTIDFDVRLTAGAFTEVALRYRFQDASFGGWRYAFDVPLDAPATWFAVAVTFDPSWSDAEAIANGWQQDLFDAVGFAQTMSDVYRTEIRLEMDPASTFAIAHVDNFQQNHAVPEPSSGVLVAFAALGGLLALGTARHRRRAVAGAAAWLLAGAGAAHAGVHNVSQFVLGVAEPTPAIGGLLNCGFACSYATASGAQMGNGWTATLAPPITAAWPVPFSFAKPGYSAVDDALAVTVPAGVIADTLAGGLQQRAQVAFSPSSALPASARRVDVQTWRSGSGAAVASYAVRIDTPAGPARRTLLRLALPTIERASKHAGYHQGTFVYTEQPTRLQSRLAVDVYVDGLPVWSSSSIRLLPKRFDPDVPQILALDTGPAIDGRLVELFLGTLPGGSSRVATIVMRSDLRVDAPTCHTQNNTLGDDWLRCDTRLEGLRLPTHQPPPTYEHQPYLAVFTF